MTGAIAGRPALVTGAGSGLGAATAWALAAEGCPVALLDRNEAAARSVCDELGDAGSEALALGVDVSRPEEIARAVDLVVERFAGVSIAVSCAAIDYVVPVAEMSLAQWDSEIAVNLRGPFLVARAVWPQMVAAGGGDIVNVASTAALRAWANAGAYHASKWGLLGLSRGLGVEGRPYRIRVTAVIPGGMRTHFFDRFPEQGIPLPDESHLQDPANVARSIVFAVSMPPESAVQEMLVTPLTETSWP